MLKKTISYIDYDGKERTEDFYFNLNKAELAEMELSQTGGLVKTIERITMESDNKALWAMFKSIVLKAYGKKSDDGRRFIKSEELSTEFSQTEAFNDLIVSFFENADAASAFMNGIVPQGK